MGGVGVYVVSGCISVCWIAETLDATSTASRDFSLDIDLVFGWGCWSLLSDVCRVWLLLLSFLILWLAAGVAESGDSGDPVDIAAGLFVGVDRHSDDGDGKGDNDNDVDDDDDDDFRDRFFCLGFGAASVAAVGFFFRGRYL